ncbi:MAG: YggU family protein [Planctomycetaceae bacterium]|nr:YggU family protein [Planctomycetaceae bacterium]
MSSTHYHWIGDELRIQLRVSPRASRDQVGDLMGDRLKISITAPPVDGEANDYLIRYLAKEFGVARSQVSVVQGQTNRNKTLSILAPSTLPVAFLISRD